MSGSNTKQNEVQKRISYANDGVFVIVITTQMRKSRLPVLWPAFLILAFCGMLLSTPSQAGTTNYFVRGIIKEVRPEERQLVIAHEDIPGFMEAMTMPFNVKDAAIFAHTASGEKIAFELHVTKTESWVDHVKPAGGSWAAGDSSSGTQTNSVAAAHPRSSLRTFKFTNENGQLVSLSDFRGQAIALTFFFTHCPIPEFCPRLSRNFEEVQRRLGAMQNAPTNWHLLSVTFDPERDTPDILKSYGTRYAIRPGTLEFSDGAEG